ncbi:hypothetical protein IV203_012257 [Nitzschia inconspicua]|uniref:Uncharacterized protein n=1 Tax=Nitzschia inconspicua TaxID=303405 RepID=A0A9K3PJK7_9STRA|nr:hypothetical protein IV203_012257 [Nitzschia inconspicua]
MEEKQAENPVSNGDHTEIVASFDQQQELQTQRRLKMKEEMIPASRGGGAGMIAPPPRPCINSFTFSMPSNRDDQSIASTITMSTMKSDRSASVDIFDFPEETLEDDRGVVSIDYEQASNSTPDAGCFHFEKAMDTVFVKIYEVFLDEDALVFACQDEPRRGSPILEYDATPDIPAVISMTSDVASEPNIGLPSQKDGELPLLSLEENVKSSTKHDGTEMEAETQQGCTIQSVKELNAVMRITAEIFEDKDVNEFDSSPWRLDSILYSSLDRKDESIEVGEAGEVVLEETTIEFDTSSVTPLPNTEQFGSKQDSPLVGNRQEVLVPAQKKQDSFYSYPGVFATQNSFFSLDSTMSKSSTSKKRSLGLRYLLSPRLRKLNVLPWRRRSPKKYQNMRKLDDPSYSPGTVTTLEPSTLHSDGLSFQCDMSLKTSSVVSLKTSSVLMKQELHARSQGHGMYNNLSYAYPHGMVA